ncbi:response regulator [Polymorphobacter glacialis]|uniref:Response regulator n=1 Tax=Sandarakinorhabdus glacialis TaxID=1614636 RepID=A0A916ZV35_9SPHN|nr:response regulator [Polymorphobacter glacialis]GGE12942.1 response regulator [Polymorphobacter glacialis]
MTDGTANNGRVSLRDSLGPYLPYLRRYGRALTGSQRTGDAFVRAALEALLQAPDQFDPARPARIELFRIFHAFWSPVSAQVDGDGPNWSSVSQAVGETLLARLASHRREALLLTAVEGFSIADTATILSRTPDEVRADISTANAEIAAQMAGRVLIIEDEPIIAMDLQNIVEGLGHTVVGIAATRTEALALSDANETDLVLADIQLADGSSGIDAVKDILAGHDVPVVFVTAFPERLLTGERPEPTYLITKPFEVEMLVATIGQALMLQRQPELA